LVNVECRTAIRTFRAGVATSTAVRVIQEVDANTTTAAVNRAKNVCAICIFGTGVNAALAHPAHALLAFCAAVEAAAAVVLVFL
jgi:hypothetical protein